jgi:hemolysin III
MDVTTTNPAALASDGAGTDHTMEGADLPSSVIGADRPSWRGRMHAWTFFAAIPAGTMLILRSERAVARTASVIYVVSVLALFGTSAAYHRLAQSMRARRIMRRLDHSMIFVLIAGTYTPLCLLALPLAWGIPVLSIVAVGAIAGVLMKLIAFDSLRWFGSALYPILGWTAVVAMPALVDHLSAAQLALIIAGGIVYTIGIPVLLTKRPNPWPRTFGYHEVWHTCTVVAGLCHFAAVMLLVG